MSKIAHAGDSEKRKLASSTIPFRVHVCAMSDSEPKPAPWYAGLYPYADAAEYDRSAAWKRLLHSALKIEETTAEKNREWIARICDIVDITPTQLAREASLSPSTLNRFLKQTSSSANLSASTLASILEAAERLVVNVYAERRNDNDFMNKAKEYDVLGKFSNAARFTRTIPVIGNVHAGGFSDPNLVENPVTVHFDIELPVKGRYADMTIFGFEYFTDFPGEAFDSRDIIIAIPIWKYMFNVMDGNRIILNRRRDDGKIETSLREIFLDKKQSAWLASVDGEADKFPPIYLGKNPLQIHTDDLALSFLVIGVYHWAW